MDARLAASDAGAFDQLAFLLEQMLAFNEANAPLLGANAVTFGHSDHLGSVSLATTSGGSGPVVVSEQLFTPWGAVRTGGIGQTTTNYTGQRLDGSGLL